MKVTVDKKFQKRTVIQYKIKKRSRKRKQRKILVNNGLSELDKITVQLAFTFL